MYNAYIPTNKNGNHKPISFYMADGMFSYLYYSPVDKQHLGSMFAFWLFYPLSL